MTGSKESRKEGKNLTPEVDYVSVTSIVMPARPGSSGAAVGTMAMQFKLFSLLLPLLLITFLSSLFSVDTRGVDSKLKREKAKVEAENSGCVSSLTS